MGAGSASGAKELASRSVESEGQVCLPIHPLASHVPRPTGGHKPRAGQTNVTGSDIRLGTQTPTCQRTEVFTCRRRRSATSPTRGHLSENPQDLHTAGFVDRFSEAHLQLQGPEGLARAFAGAEPATVTMYIDDTEQEYLAGGYKPGDRWLHDLLREKQAGFALARQWAGHEQELGQHVLTQ